MTTQFYKQIEALMKRYYYKDIRGQPKVFMNQFISPSITGLMIYALSKKSPSI